MRTVFVCCSFLTLKDMSYSICVTLGKENSCLKNVERKPKPGQRVEERYAALPFTWGFVAG